MKSLTERKESVSGWNAACAAFVKAKQAETESEQRYESLESSPVAFLRPGGRFFDLGSFHLEPGLAPFLPGCVRDERRLILERGHGL